MPPMLLLATLALGLLAAAWSAGFFWTWSFTVMPGLGRAPAEAAIAAMRATNAGIATPGFAFVFFGPAVLALLAAALGFLSGRAAVGWPAGLAALVYAAGVLAVTFAVNIPLNDGLARAAVTPANAAEVWRAYDAAWTAWNHLRTAAATLAFLALLWSTARAAAVRL
jgi:uncharacterized membrane protein